MRERKDEAENDRRQHHDNHRACDEREEGAVRSCTRTASRMLSEEVARASHVLSHVVVCSLPYGRQFGLVRMSRK